MVARQGQRLARVRAFMACIILVLLCAAPLGTALAQAVPATCDPRYWDSLQARAWAEAQREISQNQNLIYKPDSILEYSCFDRFLQSLAYNIHTRRIMFSETPRWGTSPPGNIVTTLNALVVAGLRNYIEANFSHTYLGDRSSIDYGTPPLLPSSGGAGTYACSEMSKVWNAAKCINFIDKSHDDFFSLDDYRNFDPRKLPNACVASGPGDGRWPSELDKARNVNNTYPKEPYNASHKKFFDVSSCAADPIKTGVTVSRANVTPYEEHICVNPGCAYDIKSKKCEVKPQCPYNSSQGCDPYSD